MNSNMHTINRRSNFARSNTVTSSGVVPIDGEKPLRSNSASSSSSMLSSASTGPIPTVICVQSKSSTNSLDSGLQMKNDENNKLINSPISEYLRCCDERGDLTVEALCHYKIGYIINASTFPLGNFERSTSCECLGKSSHNPETIDISLEHIASSKDILECFGKINAFITKARHTNSKVLIFAPMERRSLGIVFAIQHLMWYYKIDMDHAISHWQRLISSTEVLDEQYMETLKIWMNENEKVLQKRGIYQNSRPSSEGTKLGWIKEK